MLPNVTAVEGQVTDVGVFVTAFCQGDADGDGFTGAQGDCDNNNASAFPGAAEICDGVDNNCDTVIDEGGVCAGPVDCEVSDWSAFSACTVACGGGTATRTRTITQAPQFGGAACPALTEAVACNTAPYPTQCYPGETDCNGQCANINTDANNCGGCNVACGAGESCSNGACVAAAICGDGIVDFSVESCDTAGDSVSCDSDCTAVACGDGHLNSATGETCDDGNAIDGDGCSSTCQHACPVDPLLGQPTFCSGTCVHLAFDTNNCGACGVTCGAGQFCGGGSCLNTPSFP